MKRLQPKLKKFTAGLAMVATLALSVPPAQAEIFNPNFIISDAEMRASHEMNFMDIYHFLDEKGGLNSHFDVDPEDGLLKGTAQLIDDAAKRYRINPRYVLAVLQKESGIIETNEPTQKQLDWAAGYALCDGCYKQSTLAQKYMGFGKQIDAAAGWVDWYMTNASELTYLKQPGTTFAVSGYDVTPANLATAALYNYTPHLHGNKLLWSIWQRWWGEGLEGISFPDGTLVVNTDSGAAAVIQNGKFRPIVSASVLATRFGRTVPVELGKFEFEALEKAAPGTPIRFPDLALVRDETETVWLLVGDERRPVDADTFREIGFNPEEVEDVATADITDYAPGDAIVAGEAYPFGQLVQDSTTGGVFYVKSGVKRPIWDRAIMDAHFSEPDIVPMTPDELAEFEPGDPLPFPEGALIKSPDDPRVFVISGGMKRPIPSEEVFLAFGYKWTSILDSNDRALAMHPVGEPLLLMPEDQQVEIAMTN